MYTCTCVRVHRINTYMVMNSSVPNWSNSLSQQFLATPKLTALNALLIQLFPLSLLQALVERLHNLDVFLTDFINRRQQRGYSALYSRKGAGAAFGGGYAPTAGGLFGAAYQVSCEPSLPLAHFHIPLAV